MDPPDASIALRGAMSSFDQVRSPSSLAPTWGPLGQKSSLQHGQVCGALQARPIGKDPIYFL